MYIQCIYIYIYLMHFRKQRHQWCFLWCLSYFEYARHCLLVWPFGPSWSKGTNKTRWGRIACARISASVTTAWYIPAQTLALGHCGSHWPGVWLGGCRPLATCMAFEHAPKTNALLQAICWYKYKWVLACDMMHSYLKGRTWVMLQ